LNKQFVRLSLKNPQEVWLGTQDDVTQQLRSHIHSQRDFSPQLLLLSCSELAAQNVRMLKNSPRRRWSSSHPEHRNPEACLCERADYSNPVDGASCVEVRRSQRLTAMVDWDSTHCVVAEENPSADVQQATLWLPPRRHQTAPEILNTISSVAWKMMLIVAAGARIGWTAIASIGIPGQRSKRCREWQGWVKRTCATNSCRTFANPPKRHTDR